VAFSPSIKADGAMTGRSVPIGAAEVEVVGLSKRFGQVVAVDGIDLTIANGDFFSLLGPSGCGKTTLLRLIGGFELPDDGSIRIGGRDVTGGRPYDRPTNMIFQHLALFPHMSVFNNVSFGLRMKRQATEEIQRRVRETLALVRMGAYENRAIDQLSGGQQQRVAIARALVNDPAVLLLDEPLGALDLKLRQELQVELRRLHQSLKSTFVFVTHDQGEALAMSNRIAVMNDGRIVQVGTPDELYDQPASRFVAQFIGNTNLLDGRIAEVCGNGRYLVESAGRRFLCVGGGTAGVGAPVHLSLRFEKLRVLPRGTAEEAMADGESALTSCLGTVVDRTFMGATLRFEVRVSDPLVLTVDVTNDKMAADCHTIGARVGLAWAPESIRLLDA
jgi:spermidine/putrescine transport system ATP-binding protein